MVLQDLRKNEVLLGVNKLEHLLENLQEQYQAGEYQTQQDVLDEFRKVFSEYLSKLNTTLLDPQYAVARESPSYDAWNKNFQELGWDLSVIFTEMQNLENLIVRNFNYMVTEKEKLNTYVKRIASKLDDYILYANEPASDIIYFKDSFNDTSKVDMGSKLLGAKQCDIDTAQGIITLPVVNADTSQIIRYEPIVNASSNGTAGNFNEIGVDPHDNLKHIVDNNADTWFEYERVSPRKVNDTEPLILDLTLRLTDPTVINFIRINPNNFGAQTPVSIKTIDTSYDGNTWTSIKDDIPVVDYRGEDEVNIFNLAQSTNGYTGQALFTFTPRKIKYVHIVLIQETPYVITTAGGYRWRYAIGIRDIELRQIKYETTGELISKAFESLREIKKVTILASENPIEVSELADIKHQISIDDGSTWVDIQTQNRSGFVIPEIVNFNNIEPTSIVTPAPIYKIRHKMVLSRDSAQFTNASTTLSKTIKQGSHIGALSQTSPIKVILEQTPIPATVKIANPIWCSRAIDGYQILYPNGNTTKTKTPAAKIVGRSNGQANQRFRNVLSEEINSGQIKIHGALDGATDYNEIVIWIDNDCTSWSRVRDITTLATVGSAKNYVLETDGTLVFGDYKTDANPDVDYSGLLSVNGTSDGYDLDDIDATVNRGNGAIPPAGSIISITLKEEALLLSAGSPHQATLKFSSDGDKNNTHIYRRDLIITPKPYVIPPGTRIIKLPHQRIVSNTIVLSANAQTFMYDPKLTISAIVNAGDYFLDETNGLVYLYTAVGPTITNATITYSYEPWLKLSNDTWTYLSDSNNQKIQINDNVYGYRKSSVSLTGRISSLGDKPVVPNSVLVLPANFNSTSDPFQVKFIDGEEEFYTEDTAESKVGWYSIDYLNGLIYCSPDDTMTGTVTYSYADFIVCYNIAKYLDAELYECNAANKTITIDSSQAFNLWADKDATTKQENLIKILYDYVAESRESVAELEPYFSPIVREYALKISVEE